MDFLVQMSGEVEGVIRKVLPELRIAVKTRQHIKEGEATEKMATRRESIHRCKTLNISDLGIYFIHSSLLWCRDTIRIDDTVQNT